MRKLIEKKRRDFRRLTKNGVSILCLMMMLVLLASAVFAVAEENASTSAPASDGAGVTTVSYTHLVIFSLGSRISRRKNAPLWYVRRRVQYKVQKIFVLLRSPDF